MHGCSPHLGLAEAVLLKTLHQQYLPARAAGAMCLLTAEEMQAAQERFKTHGSRARDR